MKRYLRQLVAIALALPLLVVSYQNCSGQFQVQQIAEQAIESTFSAEEALKIRRGDLIACPMIACAAPPENCSYEQEPIKQLMGQRDRCPTSCGKLVCKGPKICPMLACAAPPEGCELVPNNQKDADGCSNSCGDVVCKGDRKGDGQVLPPIITPPRPEPICPRYSMPFNLGRFCRVEIVVNEAGCNMPKVICDPKPPVIDCPLYPAVMPPEGCRHVYEKDRKGCEIRKTVCDATEEAPIACPMIKCAAPPAGCYYKGSGPDENGCQTCGVLVCDKQPPIAELPPPIDLPAEPGLPGKPKICPMIAYLCSNPGPGCRYSGKPNLDANGCEAGCGQVICDEVM
jgi:hypothetical protein